MTVNYGWVELIDLLSWGCLAALVAIVLYRGCQEYYLPSQQERKLAAVREEFKEESGERWVQRIRHLILKRVYGQKPELLACKYFRITHRMPFPYTCDVISFKSATHVMSSAKPAAGNAGDSRQSHRNHKKEAANSLCTYQGFLRYPSSAKTTEM